MTRGAYRILVGKDEGKMQVERPKRRRKNDKKIYHQEI
jgi:hypothetical protein